MKIHAVLHLQLLVPHDLSFSNSGPHRLFGPVLFAMFQRDFIIKLSKCKYHIPQSSDYRTCRLKIILS
jgi:hypothetical protein